MIKVKTVEVLQNKHSHYRLLLISGILGTVLDIEIGVSFTLWELCDYRNKLKSILLIFATKVTLTYYLCCPINCYNLLWKKNAATTSFVGKEPLFIIFIFLVYNDGSNIHL